jgi:hypothetical protein
MNKGITLPNLRGNNLEILINGKRIVWNSTQSNNATNIKNHTNRSLTNRLT